MPTYHAIDLHLCGPSEEIARVFPRLVERLRSDWRVTPSASTYPGSAREGGLRQAVRVACEQEDGWHPNALVQHVQAWLAQDSPDLACVVIHSRPEFFDVAAFALRPHLAVGYAIGRPRTDAVREALAGFHAEPPKPPDADALWAAVNPLDPCPEALAAHWARCRQSQLGAALPTPCPSRRQARI